MNKRTCIFAALALSSACLLRADIPATPQPPALELIKSPNEPDRISGRTQILKARRETIQALIAIIESPRRKTEDGWMDSKSSRNVAVRCLGEYRAIEAIPALTKLLEPQPDERVADMGTRPRCPAVEALANIGEPSLRMVREILADGHIEWPYYQSRFILLDIEGFAAGKRWLQQTISEEKDPARKANFEKNLEAFDREFIVH